MSPSNNPRLAVAGLRQAVPYLRLFEGRCFVVKVSGEIFQTPESIRALMEQIGVLHHLGIRVVLVHGGGPQISELAEAMGAKSEKVAGRRITDEVTMDAAVMALCGRLRTRLLGLARSLHVPAVGISGIDGGSIRAKRRPPVMVDGKRVDYGLVGDVISVDDSLIRSLLEGGFLPVVSPVAANDEGQALNINADVVAATLARELGAEKLIIVAGVPGILGEVEDPGSLVSYTDIRGLNQMVKDGVLADGMLPKAAAIKDALYGGVHRVHLISYRVVDSLLMEVFTNEGSGTLVVTDTKDLLPAELQPMTHTEKILGTKEAEL